MRSQIRISAKNLGALGLPSFCPRCFWIQRHAEGGLPYQIFPGIFNSIDSYGKKLVHGWFDRHGSAPPWLASLGDVKGYRPPPHHSKFQFLDAKSSVLLTGSPDGVLIRGDDSHLIIDYKTAKFTEHQDELFPMYEVQLNAYAYLGERCGFSPVSGLALIYTKPVTDATAAARDASMTQEGFLMGFSSHIVPVRMSLDVIPELLWEVHLIDDCLRAPESKQGCKDCSRLENLLSLTSD